MKRKNPVVLALIIIIVVLIIAGIVHGIERSRHAHSDSTVTLGAVLSLTGAGVQDADTVKEGIDFAIADLNKKGDNVKVIYADDNTDPTKTISGIQYVKSQGAQAIIGFTWDFLYNAAIPILNQEKIVGITATNTAEYTTPGPYGFYMAPKTATSEPVLEKFLKDNNIHRLAFLGSNYTFSKVQYQYLQQAAKADNVTIVGTEWMDPDSEVTAINTVIPKIKAENPDALFAMVDDDQALSLFFQRVQQNNLKVPILAGETTIGRFLADHPGILAKDYPVYSLVPGSDPQFIKYYQQNHNGETPGEYTEYAYDSVMVLYQAITASHGQDILTVMENSTFKGFVNSYTFDAQHDISTGLWTINKVN